MDPNIKIPMSSGCPAIQRISHINAMHIQYIQKFILLSSKNFFKTSSRVLAHHCVIQGQCYHNMHGQCPPFKQNNFQKD